MKRISILIALSTTIFIAGCTPEVGFAVGGYAGGPYMGTEVVATQDGIHGNVRIGGEIVR